MIMIEVGTKNRGILARIGLCFALSIAIIFLSLGCDKAKTQKISGDSSDCTAIAAGSHHSLALRSDGSIVGWGWDKYGQLDCPYGNDFVAIAVGLLDSLALRSDGSIVCWGLTSEIDYTPPPGW